MSEAAGDIKEETPTIEVKEEVAANPIADRRSSSVEAGNDAITLVSIFYGGKQLRLDGAVDSHIYGVVFRILKNVCQAVPHLFYGFPDGWDQEKQPDKMTILKLTKLYSKIAKPFASAWSGSYNTETLGDWGEPNCKSAVAAAITTYAYECAVPRPADLNHYYKSFTSETYGETNLEQMGSIIDELAIGPHDVFVDLGSGIGQLVCFTAAYAKCKKSVGIELSQIPSNYASELGGYFRKLMSHFGKNHGKFEHFQGDFLNPKYKKLICEEATVIFINNFAFSPDLMIRIKNELLQDLKHGTRIITTKPFGDHKKDITYRSTDDINAISHTHELKSFEFGVSWTSKQVQFFCTTMDHTKLIRYYEEERRKKMDPNYKPMREGSETEQAAASQQSPKWNEPDTEYAPPTKKPKKEKLRESSISTPSVKESKKKKSISVSKPAKTPKSSKHEPSTRRSSETASHSTPSQPKPTAPPPSIVSQQNVLQKQPKTEQISEPEMVNGEQHLDAKMRCAIQSIREAANSSAQAAAIQEAIDSVLSQPTTTPSQPTSFVLPTSYTTAAQNLPAPVPVYPAAPVAPPPPPPPPNVMPPNSELVAEQRHTFMIPPTDPLYNIIVNYYFEFKNFYNKAKIGDPEITNQLRQDIENEKFRRNELNEATLSTNNQIEELLASGVSSVEDKLEKLGMHSVRDVSELLAGSKQIVTQHKGLTSNVHHMESCVAMEEQKLRMLGGPDAVRHYNEAISQSGYDDVERMKELVISTRPLNFVAQVLPENSPNADSKVSPSSRRQRQPRQRQPTANGGKRGNSGGRKSDGTTEDVEMEIRQFVKHALQVDNAVKEKERKARGNFLTAAERIS